MKKRNIFAVILFSIITLGIYDLFWLVSTKKVLNRSTQHKIPSIWLLFAPVLLGLLFVGIAVAIGVHNDSQSVTYYSSDGAYLSSEGGSAGGNVATIVFILLYLIALLVIIPVTFYWFLKYSKAVNEYTKGELGTGVTFLLLYVLRFVGIAFIQDKFNDMIEAGSSVQSSTTSTTPAV